MSAPLTIAAVGALVVVVAVLAMCEVVLVHISRARASTLGGDDDDQAPLLELLERRQTNTSVAVVLRVVAAVAAVVLVLLHLERIDAEPWTRAVAVGACGVALVTAEALPKVLGMARTDAVARRVTPITRALSRLPILPAIGEVFARSLQDAGGTHEHAQRAAVSEEELLAFAEVAVEADVIEVGEQALIESIIAFGDTIVREVMIPRPDMITVEADWRVSDVMEVVILNGFSRIPVIGENIDDVIGIAYAKDLMRAERDGRGSGCVREHVRDARVVPEQQRVSILLPEMQASQFHMAVVVDEYGGVAGLVTLEDLIEELVGEIYDEFDVEDPMAEPLGGGSYRVNARMPVDELGELLDAELPGGDWDTVGGLLFGVLGRVPTVGEGVELDGLRLSAARVQGRRIAIVRIDPLPAELVDDDRAASAS